MSQSYIKLNHVLTKPQPFTLTLLKGEIVLPKVIMPHSQNHHQKNPIHL